jgi:hypothetical protein
MDTPPIGIYDLKELRQPGQDLHSWLGRSEDDRLSAVEVLRQQFGKLPAGNGYRNSKRLRRVLRILQQA